MSAAAEARRREDAQARSRAQTEFETPLLLEAGAGTGKTAVLVARIVAWCLGPGWEKSAARLAAERAPSDREVAAETLRRVVAITFTEAAAAEMSSRVARVLLDLHAGGAPVGVDRDALPPGQLLPARALALVEVLDQLPARTIHAFCRRLLLANPLEARLHPELRVDPDGQRQAEVAREVLEAYLPRALSDLPDPDLQLVLAGGTGLAALEESLIQLLREGVQMRDLDPAALAPERVEALRDRLVAALRGWLQVEGGRLADLGGRAPAASDTAAGLRRLFELLEREPLFEEAREAFHQQVAGLNRTTLGDWARGEFGKGGGKALGDDAEPLAARTRELRSLLLFAERVDLPRLAAARRVLAELLSEASARLCSEGVEGFGGLLRRARDLLVEHPEVAGRLRGRIDQLLVDEFQDTDATQCELVAALALPGGGVAGPRPGLFLVGDPKQSIYGWRNADLAAYGAFRQRLLDAGGRVLPLVVNHRSVPAILDEVARAVAPVMHETPGLQPPFEHLLPGSGSGDDAGHRDAERTPVEHWASDALDADGSLASKTSARDAAETEARAVATDLVALREAGADLAKVGLLVRAGGDLETYLLALRRAGVPFAVERERAFYQRREVMDATSVLRCILDVHDHVALVGALRSPWVGVPDAALLPLWRRRFPDQVAGLGEGDDRVPDALRAAVEEAAGELPAGLPGVRAVAGFHLSLLAFLEDLARLRRLHREAPADVFVERLRLWLLPEAVEAGRFLGAHRVAHMERWFRDLLEALEEAGGSAAAVAARLRRAASLDREQREGRTRSLAPGAVQVMTIHRAKGLDFDHVYLLQTHKGPGGGRDRRSLVARHGGAVEYELLGLPTPGLFAAEQVREAVGEHELVRLLYVALTRARRRLVVAGLRGNAERGSQHATLLRERRGTRPDLSSWLAEAGERGAREDADGVLWRLAVRTEEAPLAAPVARAGGAAWARRVAEDARRLAELQASAEARSARRFACRATEQEAWVDLRARAFSDERDPDALPRDDARAAGTAVHAWLERVPLDEPPAQWGALQDAVLGDLSPRGRERARAVMERFLMGPLAARLGDLAAHVVARELPVLLAPDAIEAREPEGQPVGTWTGSIDLLYRDPESGELVVADYKTDAVGSEADLDAGVQRYAGQGAVYCRAVQRALDLPAPPRFELWFLAGDAVRVARGA